MGCDSQENQKICENIYHPVVVVTCIGNTTKCWKREMEVTTGNKGHEGHIFQLFFFAMLEGRLLQSFLLRPSPAKNVRATLILQFNFLNPWVHVPATLLHLDHRGYVGDYKQNSSLIL